MAELSAMFLADADAAPLLSPIKPILAALTFLPWAWLISSKLDKDAAYFHLNRVMWNSIHMAAGAAAVVSILTVPVFWVGWPLAVLLLLAPILVYWKVRNDSVPERAKFHLTTQSIADRLAVRRARAATRAALINFADSQGKARDVPQKEDARFPTHLLVEDLLGPAIEARATKIEVVPGKGAYVVSQTVDGVKYGRDPVAPDSANQVIDYLKEIAGLDVQNRRRRQVGSFRMNAPSGSGKVTLTTAGSSAGQEMRLEFNRQEQLDKPFDALGLLPRQMEALRAFEKAPDRRGIVLLGAPRGHGLTTLGYSFVGRHDAYTTNVKTLEREVMLRRDGVDHVTFDADNPDADFATNLQSILRRDPDVVLISDIEDKETARVAATQATDGNTLIYIPQRQPGVREQIVDWVKRVGDIRRAVKPLRAAVNGRLLRTVCPNCRQSYQPTAEQLRKLGLPGNIQQLYKAGGKVQVKNKIENCPVCQGTGYFGQIGVYEVMVIDDTVRKMIANNDLQGAYTHCRRNKMIFQQEAALQKVVEGVTTLEEVSRVFTPKKAAPKPPPQPRPQPAEA